MTYTFGGLGHTAGTWTWNGKPRKKLRSKQQSTLLQLHFTKNTKPLAGASLSIKMLAVATRGIRSTEPLEKSLAKLIDVVDPQMENDHRDDFN